LKTNKDKLLYIIAGEASGDLHAANLMKQLKLSSVQSLCFRGLGGPLMGKEGFSSLAEFNKLGVMGFSAILSSLPFFIKLKNKIVYDIMASLPEKIILIDYPGFNLEIAKAIKKLCNIPVIYYISPQIWAWKERRLHLIKQYVDEMVVIFPFEVDWYKTRGMNVRFFGHPLIDIYRRQQYKPKSPAKITVGIFPGSRIQETKKHIPVLKKTVKQLQNHYNNIDFVVGLTSNQPRRIINELGLNKDFCKTVVDNSFLAFHLSDVAIVTSGTATLECAITKTPFVVIYKTSLVNWLLSSLFIKLKYISIVNILANKELAVECVQRKCVAGFIVGHVKKLLHSNQKIFVNELNEVVARLGPGGAYERTAKFILNYEK